MNPGEIWAVPKTWLQHIYASDDLTLQFYEKFEIRGYSLFLVLSVDDVNTINRVNKSVLVLTEKGPGRIPASSDISYNLWRYEKVS